MQAIRLYFNPTNIYATQRPIIMATYFMGIIPFTREKAKDYLAYKVTKLGLLNTIWHLMLFTVSLIFTIHQKDDFVSHFFKTGVSKLTSLTQLLIFYIAMIITYITCYVKRYKLIETVDLLGKVDNRFRRLGIQPVYKKSIKYILKCFIVNFSIFVVYLAVNSVLQVYLNRTAAINTWISYFAPHLVLSIVAFIFLSILTQIKYRFVNLNMVRKYSFMYLSEWKF